MGTANAAVYKGALGSKSEVWCYTQVRFVTSAANGTLIFDLDDSAGNAALQVDVNGTSLRVYGGSATASTVASVSANTTYHLWIHYKKNAGANDDVSEIWFSTTGTKPADGSNNHAKVTAGTSNLTVDRFLVESQFGTVRVVFDKMRCSSLGDLGDNPN